MKIAACEQLQLTRGVIVGTAGRDPPGAHAAGRALSTDLEVIEALRRTPRFIHALLQFAFGDHDIGHAMSSAPRHEAL
jgi:hypothetical protein